jgi:DNA repair exonuclease SbcCD ATPase subunit
VVKLLCVAQVDQFQQRKQQELATMTSQLAQLQQRINSTDTLLGQALRQQADTAASVLNSAQTSEAAAAQALHEAMQSAGEGMAAALAALTSSLQAQGSQLATFAKEQQAAAQAAAQGAAAGFGRAKEAVAGISSSVRSLGSLSQSTTAAAGDSLAVFAAQFEESMAAKQEQLLEQVGSLLAGFVQDRRQAVAGIVQGVRQQLGEGQRQLVAAAAEVTAAADGCVTALEVSRVLKQLQHMYAYSCRVKGLYAGNVQPGLRCCCWCVAVSLRRCCGCALLRGHEAGSHVCPGPSTSLTDAHV